MGAPSWLHFLLLLSCFASYGFVVSGEQVSPERPKHIKSMCRLIFDDCINMMQAHYGVASSNGTNASKSILISDYTVHQTLTTRMPSTATTTNAPDRSVTRYRLSVKWCDLYYERCLSSLQSIEDKYQKDLARIAATNYMPRYKATVNTFLYLTLLVLAVFSLGKWLMPARAHPSTHYFRRCMTCTLLVQRPVALLEYTVQPARRDSPQDDAVELTAAQADTNAPYDNDNERCEALPGSSMEPLKMFVSISGPIVSTQGRYPTRLALSILIAANIATISCVMIFIVMPASDQLQHVRAG